MGDERDIRPDHAGDPTSDAGPTVTQAREPRSTTMRETLRIEVIEGPDAGGSIVLSPSSPLRVLVGTGPACHLLLTDATVSRRHLAFEPSEGRFRISDLGSRNGTFVDGVAVVEAFIAEGQIIRCGSTALRVDSQAVAAGATLPSRMRFGRTLGASEAMRRLFPLCERLAASRVPVLIEGETGTGKEVLAESIHEQSGLSGPFVVFDCTTVAPSLLEAELFGHERGAFTGATSTRPGIFEQAMGGTIFIDEIGDFDLALQPKLLRAIDRGEIRRVGGKETIRVDARILAATRRDLDREVAAGRFRDDLFHRLAVGRIELPALRERKGDVSLLARAFAEQLDAPPDTLTADLLARLEDYAWPGHLRDSERPIDDDWSVTHGGNGPWRHRHHVRPVGRRAPRREGPLPHCATPRARALRTALCRARPGSPWRQRFEGLDRLGHRPALLPDRQGAQQRLTAATHCSNAPRSGAPTGRQRPSRSLSGVNARSAAPSAGLSGWR
jgi:hypothetical protein